MNTHRGSVAGWTATLGLLIGISTGLSRMAAGADPEPLTVTTNRVVIFKDGYGLVHRRGVGQTDADGAARSTAVPDAAVLGTVWASPKSGKLRGITSGWVSHETDAQQDVLCERLDQLLAANEGQSARVRLTDGSLLEGVIVRVLRGPAKPQVDSTATELATAVAAVPGFHQPPAAPVTEAAIVWRHGPATHVVLKTSDGEVAINVSEIRTVNVEQMRTTLSEKVTRKTSAKELVFHHDQPNSDLDVSWAYFRPGFRWIPTYQIRLDRDPEATEAQIELQAELLNEAEDIRDAEIDIVVGVPHFRFRDVPSPLSLEQALQATLQAIAPQLANNYQAFGNSISQVSAYGARSQEFRQSSAAASGALEGQTLELGGDLSAEGSQDLFVYNLGRRTLERGQRMVVPIFATTAKYRNLYTWNLNLMDAQQAQLGQPGAAPLQLSDNRVWRQLVLTNRTDLPWTTGPVMLMEGDRPLAQELMTYTPARNDVRVPVTVAVDVRASYHDKELHRVPNALQVANINYADIQKQVTLDVCNNKNRTIPLEVELTFVGTVTKASHDGQVVQLPLQPDPSRGYDSAWAVNSQSRVVWKVELKPGETFAPTVDYQYYVRH